MSGRKRSKPVKKTPLTIEQNVPVQSPESYKAAIESVVDAAIDSIPVTEVTQEMLDKNMNEIVEELASASGPEVVVTPRDVLLNKIKALSSDIASLEPHSECWCKMLQEIGDLKRKVDKL